MMVRIVLLVTSLLLTFHAIADTYDKRYKRKVLYYPPGVHRISKIVASSDYIVIRGAGSGVTILEVPGGIYLSGKHPKLEGFTLVGSGNRNTGITLRNNRRATINDVEIYGYRLGLLSICDYGSRQWLHVYRDLYIYEGKGGTKKTHNATISGVKLVYKGKKSSNGGWRPGGGFSNTHTFYGGRIAVPGVPLFIDGPSATKMFGTYIDIDSKPLVMTARSPGLQLFGVHLDRNSWARKNRLPVIVLYNAKLNRLKLYGQHLDLMRHGLIRDGKNKRVSKRDVYLSPDRY